MTRGILYVVIAVGSVLGPELTRFTDNPPRNGWEISAVVVACLVSAATALRAYVDQHLGNQKAEKKEELQNETNTTQS